MQSGWQSPMRKLIPSYLKSISVQQKSSKLDFNWVSTREWCEGGFTIAIHLEQFLEEVWWVYILSNSRVKIDSTKQCKNIGQTCTHSSISIYLKVNYKVICFKFRCSSLWPSAPIDFIPKNLTRVFCL